MPATMIRRLTARHTRLSSIRYYDLLVGVFVVILLISNLVGQKNLHRSPFIHLFGRVPRVSGAQLLTFLGTFSRKCTAIAVQVIYEVVATPITYWIVNNLKRAEGVDVYDRGTNFNPFARSQEIVSEAG